MPKVMNRNGLFIEYTEELADDLMAVHGLHAATIVRMMNGTKFDIERRVHDKTVTYTLKTNSYLDSPYSWKATLDEPQKVD